MVEWYVCDWDAATRIGVAADPAGGFVALLTGTAPDSDDASDTRHVFLNPSTARRLARTVTLATVHLECDDVADAIPDPCPDRSTPCPEDCPLRPACQNIAEDDVHRTALLDGNAPPIRYPTGVDTLDPEERLLVARRLAGPGAFLDDVLRVADYLKGNT